MRPIKFTLVLLANDVFKTNSTLRNVCVQLTDLYHLLPARFQNQNQFYSANLDAPKQGYFLVSLLEQNVTLYKIYI